MNGSNYEYHWAAGNYNKIGNITEIHTKAFHPNINYQPMPLNVYKEDAIPIPIPDIYSNGGLVDDLVQSIAKERQQMRKVGLWPDSGTVTGTAKATSSPYKLNFLNFLKSGWHKVFQIWTLIVNILVSAFLFIACCQCGTTTLGRVLQRRPQISMLGSSFFRGRTGTQETSKKGEIIPHTPESTPFWCPVVSCDILNPDHLFDENGNLFSVDIPIMVDTGACHNVISYYVAESLGLKIIPTKIKPLSITNHVVPIEGETEAIIKIGTTVNGQKFLVSKNGEVVEMLVGFRFTWCFPYVAFNIKEGYIDFGGEIIELIPGRRFNDLNVLSPDKTENANDQTIDDKLSVEQQLEYPNQIPPEKIADPLSLIEVPWDDFNQDEQALIRQCPERNRETFFDGQMKSLGQTSILDPIIETIPHKPFVKRPYHVPPQLIDKVYTTITDMLEAGIIEVSTDSPYLSPALWIQKPNKDLRLTIDLRELNKVLIPNVTVLPSLNSFTWNCHGKKMFSTMDLKSSFFQVPITDEKSKQMLTFSCGANIRLPNFRLRKLPQGASLSPSVLTTLTNIATAGVPDDILQVYIDDFLVMSTDLESHIRWLDTVFQRLRNAGVNLEPKKTSLFQKSVDFVGFQLAEQGLSVSQKNINKAIEIPRPRTVRQVRSFLGFTGYLRRTIYDYSNITKPMVDLLTKGTKFKWEDSHELAFKTLKQAITSEPVLAFPNLKEKFLLFCDASNSCLGAMLAQEVDKTLKPLGYFSRKLNATEQLWVICDKELLSIISALKHWYGLLKHAEVIVYTDSLSAKYIASSDKQTSSRRAKLVANLALFDKVTIIHIPGDKNTVADFLSRVYDSVIEEEEELNDLTLKERKARAIKEKNRVENLLKQDPTTVSKVLHNIMQHVTNSSYRKNTSELGPNPDRIFPMLPQTQAITDANQSDANQGNDSSILSHITQELQTYELVRRL